MSRVRFRDLGFTIGHFPTGTHNAITDVPGVRIGHCTLNYDDPKIARTGLTIIDPRFSNAWSDYSFAGYFILNGNGEMTGVHILSEFGLLTTPIALTNTLQVGLVRDSIIRYIREHGCPEDLSTPVVAETDDSWLSDIDGHHVTKDHVFATLDNTKDGMVEEGNVGAGTGLICHDFKGGIGTSSRILNVAGEAYTVGALVQANYGDRHLLRVNGIPVGEKINYTVIPNPWNDFHSSEGSIIVIIATDAPLLPVQCQRLAKRAALGLGRLGCMGHDYSGDMILTFATGNHYYPDSNIPINLKMLPHERLDPFFEAVVEAVEEAILNSMTMAETMMGFRDRKVEAIPLDILKYALDQFKPLL